MVQTGKIIPTELIVRMLRKIIYSGDGRSKFILSSFPDIVDQAKEFESTCATMTKMVYTTGIDSADTHVIEIKNNNLTLYNIDSHFQKEHRLSTLGRWEDDVFQDIYKNDVDLILIVGGPL